MPRLLRLPAIRASILLAAVATVTGSAHPAAARGGPNAPLQAAWERAREVGSYEFTTTIEHTTYPALSLANVGQHPRTEILTLDGAADGASGAMRLWLWEGARAEHDRGDAIEIEVDGDTTRSRSPGGAWQPIERVSTLFAPGNDAAGFLAAARNTAFVARTSRTVPTIGTLVLDEYAFDVDRRRLADRLREQLEHELRSAGRLPAGLTLEASGLFADSIGRGQAWIDRDGLPARLRLEFTWPSDASGRRVTASVTTDFERFDRSRLVAAFSSDPVAWASGSLALAYRRADWPRFGAAFGALGMLALMLAALVGSLRARDRYRRVTVAVTLALALSPVATIAQAHDLQRAVRALQDDGVIARGAAVAPGGPSGDRVPGLDAPLEAPRASARGVVGPGAAARASDGAPWAPPPPSDARSLLAEDVGGDADGDGLSDREELALCEGAPAGAAHCPRVDRRDTDGDGLTDGQEYKHLGTDVADDDSDGDGLGDALEVAGFGGRHSDPLHPDTDRDGRSDLDECGTMATGSCPDTDGDGVPDLFDDDSDGDGFYDAIDYAPLVATESLTGARPLALEVKSLEAGRAVFVDFQVAPDDPRRVGRATSVLDWPAGDTQGQIQRRLNSTFADLPGGGGQPTDAFGDVRLVPILEVELDGATAPLPRRTAEARLALDAYESMAVIQLIANTREEGTFLYVSSLDRTPGRSYSLTLGKGSCEAPGATVRDLAAIRQGDAESLPGNLATYADGAHFLRVTEAGGIARCLRVDTMLKDAIALTHAFTYPPRTLGSATLEQVGTDSVLTLEADATARYGVQVLAGSCRARGAVVHSAADVAGNAATTLRGRNVVDLADQRHVLVLTAGGRELVCASLPNVVNGPASQTTMVDDAALVPHGISVHEAEDGKLVANVPLVPVVDERSGRSAGLGGRMVFDTGEHAAVAAQVRLVWLVQVLTDLCGDPPSSFLPGEPEATRIRAWCAQEGVVDQPRIVHRYADDWSLAGLRVREDHGLEMATLYERPMPPPPPSGEAGSEPRVAAELDHQTMLLGMSLARRFVSGIDCGLRDATSPCAGDGRRDITVAGMPGLYDQDQPPPPGDARLGLQDIHVVRDSAATHAELQRLIQRRATDVLETEFERPAGAPAPAAPLLLFAREETFRTTHSGSPEHSTSSAAAVTLDFAPAGGDRVQPVVIAALNWAPYRRDAATGAWEAFPFNDYWERLSVELRKAFLPAQPTDEEDAEATARATVAQLFVAQLYGGQAQVVEADNQPTWQPGESVVVPGYSDEELAERVDASRNDAAIISNGGLARLVIEPLVQELAEDVDAYYRRIAPLMRSQGLKPQSTAGAFPKLLGDAVKRKYNIVAHYAKHRGNDRWLVRKGAMGAVIAVGMAGGIASFVLDQTGSKTKAAEQALGSIGVAVAAVEVGVAVKALKAKEAFSYAKTAGNAGAAAAFILTEVISYGLLIYSIAQAGLTFAGLEMNKIMADAFAGTAVAFALFALAIAGAPVGTVVSAVIALIDGVIALSCGFLSRAQRESQAGEIICKGITGGLSYLVAYVAYAQTDMVTLSDPYRNTILDLDSKLARPELGLVPSQPMTVSLGLRNTLDLIGTPPNVGALYWHQYTVEALKSSTFAYQILPDKVTVEADELHASLAWDGHVAEWQRVSPGSAEDERYAIERLGITGTVTTALAAGINRVAPAYLAEGFAIPVQECVVVPPIPLIVPVPVPVCWKRERKDTNYTNLNLRYDLFPPTLDAYLELQPNADGAFVQTWGQDGELKLPPLWDADGDGLPQAIDPDDSRWDADGDRIADRVELERDSNPALADSDGDGLSDPAEAIRGTDPRLPDTDGDGLGDGQELDGWSVAYGFAPGSAAPLRTVLRSDPLTTDADGDTILDGREKAFGFSPSAVNQASALVYETAVREPDAPIFYAPLDEPAGATAFADRAGGEPAQCLAVDRPDQAAHCPAAGHRGRFGHAVYLDGNDEYLRVHRPSALNRLAGSYSVSLWFKPDVMDRFQSLVALVDTRGGFRLGFGNDTLVLGVNDGDTTTLPAAGLVADAWNHLVVTMKEEAAGDPDFAVEFFVNGRLVGHLLGRTTGGPRAAAGGDLILGGDMAFQGGAPMVIDPYQGLLDEVVVEARAVDGNHVNALFEGRINLDDAVVTPGQDVVYDSALENLLLSRGVFGNRVVDFPEGLTDQADTEAPFALEPRRDRPDVHRTSHPFRVDAAASSGAFTLTQAVGGAIVTPSEDVWKPADSTLLFRWPGHFEFQGQSSMAVGPASPIVLSDRSFSISAWVKPTAPAGDTQRRGILGLDSGQNDSFPYLQVKGRELFFGYGTGSGKVEASVPNALDPGAWNHVGVVYDRTQQRVRFYVDGVRTDRGAMPAAVHVATNQFHVGRSTNRAQVTIDEVLLTCTGDGGGDGEYDLFSNDAVPPVHRRYVAQADDENPKVLGTGIVFPEVGSATVALCEDDDDVETNCAGNDDGLGQLTVHSFEPPRSGTVTWTTRPDNPRCEPFWFSYPDTATVKYTLTSHAIPFIGGIKDVQIFGSALSAVEVGQVRGGNAVIADLRMDDVPGQRTFLDTVGYHQGQCSPAPTRCPRAGAPGVRNTGLAFDGVDDGVSADTVSSVVAEGTEFAVSAWFRPEATLAGDGTIWSFHDAAGADRLMLQVRRIADGTFRLLFYDGAAEGKTALFPDAPLEAGVWYHAVLSRAGTGAFTAHLGSRYPNGVARRVVIGPFSAPSPATASPVAGGRFTIGREYDGNVASEPFQGEIDEVRVLRQAQSEADVTALFVEPPSARIAFERPLDDEQGVSVVMNESVAYGVDGQVGRGAAFDGASSRLAVIAPVEVQERFAFAAWVRLDASQAAGNPAIRPIFQSGGEESDPGQVHPVFNGELAFYLENGVPTLQSCPSASNPDRPDPPGKLVAQGVTVPPNIWTHLLVQRDEIYVNGARVATTGSVGDPIDKGVLMLGTSFRPPAATPCARGPRTVQHFSGVMDEVELFSKPLSPEEISVLFNTQNAWVDEERRDTVVVDRDDPTVALVYEPDYLPNAETLLHAEATDPTTRVERVEMSIDEGEWVGAQEAQDAGAAPGTAWLPVFTPGGGGVRTAQVRAIDAVGNRGPASAPRTFYVDDQPPALSAAINRDLSRPIRLAAHPTADAQWLLPIHGSVSDPFIAGSVVPGSGVDRMTITLVDADTGEVVGTEPHQVPAIVGSSYAIDYVLHVDNPTGRYIVRAEAWDRVGNAASYDLPRVVLVDNTAPGSTTAEIQVPSQPPGPFHGRPAPDAQPGDPPPLLAGLLDAGSLLQGPVSEQPPGEAIERAMAGIDRVEVGFTPSLAHAAPLDERALPDEVLLYLPLDENQSPDAMDQVYRDLAAERGARCGAARCPQSGVASRNAQSARFDGVDDALSVAHDPAIGALTADFTLAAWIKPDGLDGAGRILGMPRTDNGEGWSFGRLGDRLILTTWFVQDYVTSAGVLTPGVWQHVAVHLNADFDAEFMVNGRLVETVPGDGPALADADSPILIGAADDTGAALAPTDAPFRGAIDEVVIARGRLDAAGWDAIFGMGPTLHLPFDAARIVPSETLEDAGGMSGGARYVARPGAPDDVGNAALGIVGAGAALLTPATLAVHAAPPPGVLPHDGDSFSIALWLRDLGTGTLAYGPNAVRFAPDGIAHRFGDATFTAPVAEPGGWHHYAFVWDDPARTLSTYLDGLRVQQDAAPDGPRIGGDPTDLRLLHESPTDPFAVDDLKVYQRPLPGTEVLAMANARWWPTDLDAGGPAALDGTWFAPVPPDLEGYYDVRSRAHDRAGNVDGEPKAVWSGYVDTLAPRVLAFESAPSGDGVRHRLTVEDHGLDLSPDALRLPFACSAANTTVDRIAAAAPWYRSLVLRMPEADQPTAAQRTVQATVTCDASWAVTGDAFQVCDVADNCVQATYSGPNVGEPVPTATATAGPSPTPRRTPTRRPTAVRPTVTPAPPSEDARPVYLPRAANGADMGG